MAIATNITNLSGLWRSTPILDARALPKSVDERRTEQPLRPTVSREDQRLVLSWLAEHGDIIDASVPVPAGAIAWLLAPVSAAALHVLAMFGSETDDLEHDQLELDLVPAATPELLPAREIGRQA